MSEHDEDSTVKRLVLLLLLVASPAGADLKFREVSQTWGLSFRHHHGGSDRAR